MFVEINSKIYNAIYIQSLKKDDEDGYKIIYRIANGAEVVEEFETESARDTKFSTVESMSGGGGSPVDLSNYLAKDNTTAYTPSGDYNPATKKYVDDQVGDINTVLATLTTPSNNGGN